MDGACSMNGEVRYAYKIIYEKSEWVGPLGVRACRLKEHIKSVLRV
jgi:hypothetical protein